MIFRFSLLLLGPILWLQGKYVRRVTPVLPEPAGERQGRQGQGPELSVLIVGDSAAAGVGVDHQRDGLSGQLIDALGHGFSIRWLLFATSGDTSAQLLEKLGTLKGERYDSAVVSIGVNDVTGLTRSAVWKRNLHEIVRTLRHGFGVNQIYLSCVPPMHLFPALPQPLRWWMGARARHFNDIMRSVAAGERGCEWVNIPYSGNIQEAASDGFHPGPAAYRIWGSHLASLLLSRGNRSMNSHEVSIGGSSPDLEK